jgi:hypothetical protein
MRILRLESLGELQYVQLLQVKFALLLCASWNGSIESQYERFVPTSSVGSIEVLFVLEVFVKAVVAMLRQANWDVYISCRAKEMTK